MKRLLNQHLLVGEAEHAVQMRLYTMTKRRFAVVSLMYLLVFACVILVSVLGPSVLTTQVYRAADLLLDSSSQNDSVKRGDVRTRIAGPYMWITKEMTVYDQNLWVSARFEPVSSELMNGVSMTRTIAFSVRVFGLPHSVVRRITSLKGQQNAEALGLQELSKIIDTSMNDVERDPSTNADASESLSSTGWHKSSREVHCASAVCEPIPLLHVRPLGEPHYLIQLRFDFGGAAYQPAAAQFMVNTNNMSFTQSVIAIRWVFAAATFLVLCVYLRKLMQYRLALWTYEQKWLLVLLVALFFFNNPFYAFVIVPVVFNGLLACCFELLVETVFAYSLLFFWLCAMHAIRQVSRPFFRFYAPKFLLVTAISCLLFANATFDLIESQRSPTFNYYFDAKQLAFAVRTSLWVFLGLYVAFLVFLVLRAYTELRMLPYFNLRLRFSIAVIVMLGVLLTLMLVIIRFDRSGKPAWLWSRNVSSDNGGGDADETDWQLTFYTQNAAASFLNLFGFSHFSQLASFYALLNLYLMLLAYCYMPHTGSLEEQHSQQNTYYNEELRFYDMEGSELPNTDEDEEDVMFNRANAARPAEKPLANGRKQRTAAAS